MWNHVYEVLKLLHTSIDLYITDVVFVERERGRRENGGGKRQTDGYIYIQIKQAYRQKVRQTDRQRRR